MQLVLAGGQFAPFAAARLIAQFYFREMKELQPGRSPPDRQPQPNRPDVALAHGEFKAIWPGGMDGQQDAGLAALLKSNGVFVNAACRALAGVPFWIDQLPE